MSDTPETDAEAERLDFKVDLNFARKLERERDEAREALVISKKTIDRLVANLKIACETNYKYDLKQ